MCRGLKNHCHVLRGPQCLHDAVHQAFVTDLGQQEATSMGPAVNEQNKT